MNKHYKAVPHIVTLLIILLAVSIWIGFNVISLWTTIACLVVFILPVVFLHREYLSKGSGVDVVFNDTGFTIKDSSSRENFVPYSDIATLQFFKSKNIEAGSMPQFPSEYYYYVIVTLKSHEGKRLILTSLMTDSNFSVLYGIKGIAVEDAYCLFPSIEYPIVLLRRQHPSP